MLYLVLALLGLAFPVRRFANWLAETGGDWTALVAVATANEPTRGMVDALIIVSTASVLFMIGECVARRDRVSIIAVPVTILLGPAVGLPLYLYLRLRAVA